MKTIKISMISMILLISTHLFSQSKPMVAVLDVDSKSLNIDPKQMGSLLRNELSKLENYKVMDVYDIDYILSKSTFKKENCFGKICLVEAGRLLKVDKMISGTVEKFNNKIVVTLRLIDVVSGELEKSQVNEFLALPEEVQKMISITLQEMFGMEVDQNMKVQLTKVNNYETKINNPTSDKLKLGGPRMGVTYVLGDNGKILSQSKSVGGFDAYPIMTQFGYQFETQYLNEGNFQALFEFIPSVTGIDQGFFIPSFTFLNGLRNSRTGWEFAFGPTFGFSRMAKGKYVNGVWQKEDVNNLFLNRDDLINRIDSRGTSQFVSGFVLAFGKTFKSGNLNVPVNFYIVPDKNGMRLGLSFGFNGQK